jgi:YVTN family beta-propeller protein
MPGGEGPTGLAFNPSGTLLYATNFVAGAVSIFDTATAERLATVATGRQPVDIAVDSVHNRAYVSNFESNDVSVLGLLSNTVLTTLRVEDKPFGVSVSGPRALAYVTNAAADSVSVIDTNASTVTGTLRPGRGPLGVAFDLTGERAYVANSDDASVARIDAATGGVSHTAAVGEVPVAFGRFGGTVRDTCGAPSPDCDDRNPFTVEACASAAGCTYTTLTGLAAADAGLGALRTTIAASAVEALGTRRTSERLGKLVVGAIAKLGLSDTSAPVTALGGREARKRVKRAGRSVTRLVRLVERGVRKRRIQRDIGLDLLDLGRATQAALGEIRRKKPAKATSLSARPRPPFAPAGR